MGKCRIAYEKLLNYVERQTSADETETLRRHLEGGCADCEWQLFTIALAVKALRAPEPLHAPEAALNRVRAAFRQRYQPAPRVPVMARLIFDSRAELAFGGARSMGDLSFHALYSADHYDIDIWQEPGESDRWYVIGQILPQDDAPVQSPLEVSFRALVGETPSVALEGSEFHIASALPGRYELNLRLATQEIIVPDVLVGP